MAIFSKSQILYISEDSYAAKALMNPGSITKVELPATTEPSGCRTVDEVEEEAPHSVFVGTGVIKAVGYFDSRMIDFIATTLNM